MTVNENEYVNAQLEESLSALVDGEATELEVRRIIKQLDDLPAEAAEQLLAKWQRYHQAGDLIRTSMSVNTPLTASFPVDDLHDDLLNVDSQQADFLLGVRKGIDASELDETSLSVSETTAAVAMPRRGFAWQNFAVAATVALGVFLGVNQYQSVQQPELLAQSVPAQPVAEQAVLVASQSSDVAIDALNADAARQLDAAQAQQRLNDYLLQHANHASQQSGQGMMPFARMANFEQQ